MFGTILLTLTTIPPSTILIPYQMGEMEMKKGTLKQSVAYCGLICSLCFLAESCDGCKSTNNQCEKDKSDRGCYQKECCQKRGFNGCWECPELSSCSKGIYTPENSPKVKAFAACIKEDGLDSFIDYVLRNNREGLSVEKGKDYDNLSFSQILKLLRKGPGPH